MKDIARKTGLGLATISSYFNGGNVREKNRKKIEAAIEELHYEVNEVARGLKTNATRTVGVVIPELNNVFCAEIITEMEDILRGHGYATIVCDCRTDRKLEQEAVDFLSRKRVDGIINMPVDTEGCHLKKFLKTGKPVVLIDRKIQGAACDSVPQQFHNSLLRFSSSIRPVLFLQSRSRDSLFQIILSYQEDKSWRNQRNHRGRKGISGLA